jgi:hypothetical protein
MYSNPVHTGLTSVVTATTLQVLSLSLALVGWEHQAKVMIMLLPMTLLLTTASHAPLLHDECLQCELPTQLVPLSTTVQATTAGPLVIQTLEQLVAVVVEEASQHLVAQVQG